MKKIHITEAKPGDITAKPLVNNKGMTLSPKGTELTYKLIDRLEAWGINELFIEGDDPNAPTPKSESEIRAEIDFMFGLVMDNPLNRELKELLLEPGE